MGRKKNEDCRKHVTEVENGRKWICNYCNDKFSGGASRIEAHLGLNGKGGGIKRCSKYPPVVGNEGVRNNMASTSSNPPSEAVNRVYSTQDQVVEGVPEVFGTHNRTSVNHQNNVEIMNLSEAEGVPQVIDTHTRSSVNHSNNVEIMNLFQDVNGSGDNRSVAESEINELKQLVIDLECEENDIAKQLQSLESRGKKRKPEVDVWLRELQEMKVDMNNNLNDTLDVSELIKNMKRHKEEKPLTLSAEFVGEELDLNIKRVFKLLEDDKVFVIGICGMGGVGKTLLATLVENEVKRKTTFKDVFWVTVSHNYSISKLQNDIEKRIGLKLDEDDENIRAHNLSSALEKKGKSILILDDVWKYIDLQKLGIHPKGNGIKVILTTRLKHVCHQMDCQPDAILQMYPLETCKGWELFMLKLGHDGTPRILPHEIEKIARCIVERFRGLPLAINVMGRTMKGIEDIHQWKHALNKLKKLEMGQMVEEEVFKVLKRSFDNLMEKNLQNCFLYCALLSIQDLGIDLDQIKKDELIMKLVDNGLINGSMCLEEIFDEGNTILDTLESHSLISIYNNYSVSTHPLVSNMACYILKESQRNVPHESSKHSGAEEETANKDVSKVLRRLAQNREAAQKSRERKKDDVKQLESSKLKLMQLELEIGRAKKQLQGICTRIALDTSFMGSSETINPRIVAFEIEYENWVDENHRWNEELRNAFQTNASEEQLRLVVQSILNHYSDLFRIKTDAAKADPLYLISGLWKPSIGRFPLWFGGSPPSELISVVLSQLEPLTDKQNLIIKEIHLWSQQFEDALSQGLDKLQQSLVQEMARDPSNAEDHQIQMDVAINKVEGLGGFAIQADYVRQQTLIQMSRILSTHQAARGLFALGEYFLRRRALFSLWTSRPIE